jgi:4-hydroxybenzoate polyprenyltransferase
MKLPAVLRALRPQQWVKNVFVLAAVVFARAAHEGHEEGYGDVIRSLYAFAAFCLGASSIYLVNDVLDVESDRAHPTKRFRPIAAGELSVPFAVGLAAASAVAALLLGVLAGANDGARSAPGALGSAIDHVLNSVVWIVAAYMVLNFAYSVKLKHVVLVDAFCIAIGFLLRVKAGGAAAHTYVSHWLMLCTLFLALFLALCKRKAEIDLLGADRGQHRANLLQYTPGFLDQMVTALAACTIVCYTMYTVAQETAEKFGVPQPADAGDEGTSRNNLIYTVPFVVFGLGRYLLLVSQQKAGGNPTRVLLGGDAIFVANALAWLATTVAIVYGGL